MYLIKDITSKDLKKISVQNQDKIVKAVGYELDPVKAFDIIKRDSKNFSEPNKEAQEADKLFADLLRKNGVTIANSEKKEKKSSNNSGTTGIEKMRALQKELRVMKQRLERLQKLKKAS